MTEVFTDDPIVILPELEAFSMHFLHPECIIRGDLIVNSDLISILLVFMSLHLLVLVLLWLDQRVRHYEVLLYTVKHYSNCTCGMSVLRL